MIDLDLAARRVAMASMAYYSLDEALLSDGEFDELANLCADRWKDLTPERRFVLVSAEKIRTSGFHVRITTAALWGTVHWLESSGRVDWSQRRILIAQQPKVSKVVGSWYPCTAFHWGEPFR